MTNERIELGRVHVPEDKKNWFKTVNRDGIVYAKPAGGQKYTTEQRRSVDEATSKVHASFVQRAESLRKAESSTLKMFKKDPMDEKLKSAYVKAKEAFAAFKRDRKGAEVKAKREARERVLK